MTLTVDLVAVAVAVVIVAAATIVVGQLCCYRMGSQIHYEKRRVGQALHFLDTVGHVVQVADSRAEYYAVARRYGIGEERPGVSHAVNAVVACIRPSCVLGCASDRLRQQPLPYRPRDC